MLDELLTTEEVARLRRKTPAALRHERHKGYGPPYIRDGNRILYSRKAVEKWLADKVVEPSN
jgi:hypothetical protein